MLFLLYLTVPQLLTEELLYRAEKKDGFDKLLILQEAAQSSTARYQVYAALSHAELRLYRPLNSRIALQQALAARPSWPYAWLSLAEWYSQQGQWSESFEISIQQTHLLGKHLPTVVWRLAYLGLHAPDTRISDETAAILDGNLWLALQGFNKKLLGRALLDRKVEVICKPRWLKASPDLAIWCEGAKWLNTVCALANLKQHERERCEYLYSYWREKASRPMR